jgi:hypothetical protein
VHALISAISQHIVALKQASKQLLGVMLLAVPCPMRSALTAAPGVAIYGRTGDWLLLMQVLLPAHPKVVLKCLVDLQNTQYTMNIQGCHRKFRTALQLTLNCYELL